MDDGVATGATARAAIRAVREQGPRRLILATLVIAAATATEISGEVDELVCVISPERFGAVGCWYDDFPQTMDAEVLALLGRGQGALHVDPPDNSEQVSIACDAGALEGLPGVPADAWGLVIFAHGQR